MQTKIVPTLSLFVLAPLVAEYLVGSLPMSMIAILPIMAAMYGSAALLIRETARRLGGGWGMTALLGLAYGLIEEGLVDQSLFNPHYLHLRLLDYGYVAALGTGLPWLIYVLTIHVVWSICVPIGLTEALFPARRTQSWLGPIALALFSVLFLAGMIAVAGFTHRAENFMATPAQLIGTAVVVVAAIAGALLLARRRAEPGAHEAPAAWRLFVVALLAGSGAMACRHFAPSWHWPWLACTAAQLAIAAGFALFMIRATRDRRWTGGQRSALVLGGLAVYALFGVQIDLTLHGAADMLPHGIIIVLFVALAAIAARKSRLADAGVALGTSD
jgi:hypothetical protein